jgi:two-component system NtrC family sensor kinase
MATNDRKSLAVSIKTRILLSFLTVILVLSVPIAALGYRVIQKDVIESAERKVLNDLIVAETVYTGEIERIGQALRLASPEDDTRALRDRLNLHYLRRVDRPDFDTLASEIAGMAVKEGKPIGGTRVISPAELAAMDGDVPGKVAIEIKATPKARPTDRHMVSSGMAKEYAVPIFDKTGEIKAVLYGGRIINRDYTLVDRVRDMVFGKGAYKSKPVGTVTIFQDDVRISTNVQDEAGQRAIGTRVSDEVYDAVIKHGRTWHERAFVVTDWYKTAYEPIRSIHGDIIGILYVGILEQPFNDMARQILM